METASWKKIRLHGIIQFSSIWLCLLFLACTATQQNKTLNRSTLLSADPASPVNTSEIRELKFHRLGNSNNFGALQLQGQLFTKSEEFGVVVIKPCSGCFIQLKHPGDTTVKANIATKDDGYFEFVGERVPYLILIQNNGMNTIEIDSIDFQAGGITTLKLINAVGAGHDRFTVEKSEKSYRWTRL